MTSAPGRQDIIAALQAAVEPLPFVTAMWEGGSAAWGRADQWSDLDLQLLVRDNNEQNTAVQDTAVQNTIEAVDAVLQSSFGIELRFEVPQPTWHGHAQVFYRLRQTSEFLLVDLAVIKQSSPNQFNERQRHGERLLMFDKTGDAVAVDLAPGALDNQIKAAVERIRQTFPLFQMLAAKEVLRGNAVAAVNFYHSHTVAPLLTLLRILHCPERFDFGPKYAQADLPPVVYQEVEQLFFVAGVEDIPARQARARELFDAALAAVDAAGVTT